MNPKVITVRKRREKSKYTTDGIFEFTSGTRTVVIKAEGDEISTAVEVAESLRRKMFPGINISNISISSYKNNFYSRNQDNRIRDNRIRDNESRDNRNRDNRNRDNRNRDNRNNKELISRIEIELSIR